MSLRLPLTLALAALLGSCGEPADEGLSRVQAALDAILATVADSSGQLQVKHAAEGVWETAGTATVLSPGDWVRTGRASSARVEFLPGGALELDEEAVVVIEALRPVEKKEAGLPDSLPLVSVQSGAVRSSLVGKGGESRPLLVRTRDGAQTRLERKRGNTDATEARVATVAGQTEVAVVTGEVSLRTGEREDLVASGSVATVQQSGTRTVAMLQSPTLDTPAADTRGRQGKWTLQWQAVEGATSYRVQVAKDAGFLRVGATRDGPETSFEFDGALGTSWWRVAARDASGRQSRWSTVRRLFLEREAPTDALLEPVEGASFGFADAPPRISFQWKPKEGARSYRLLVARSRDLLSAPVASEVVAEPTGRVETLTPGEYFWGVYAQGSELEPLFLSPRHLVVKKVKAGAVVTPKRIRKWGE